MINWINKKIDGYIFNRIIEKKFWITKEDEKYMKKYKDDVRLIQILDKIASSVVYTAMSAKTQEGIMKRNEWVRCIGHIKGMIIEKKKKPKIDRITNQVKDK